MYVKSLDLCSCVACCCLIVLIAMILIRRSFSLRVLISWSQHYSDVIMNMMASQITSVSIVYSTVCSGADQRKHQSSASLAFVRGIHRWPVNSQHKWPVTRKMFVLDDVIMMYIFQPQYPHQIMHTICTLSCLCCGRGRGEGIEKGLRAFKSKSSSIFTCEWKAYLSVYV